MDLIMLFKLLILSCVHFYSFFGLTNYTSTRGHNYKLVKPQAYCNTMPASFRLLVDELTHGTILTLTLTLTFAP